MQQLHGPDDCKLCLHLARSYGTSEHILQADWQDEVKTYFEDVRVHGWPADDLLDELLGSVLACNVIPGHIRTCRHMLLAHVKINHLHLQLMCCTHSFGFAISSGSFGTATCGASCSPDVDTRQDGTLVHDLIADQLYDVWVQLLQCLWQLTVLICMSALCSPQAT